jgi:hypothetical protein
MSESRFRKVRDAKEFLASKIVEEAGREGVPLSEVERKMLFFSERGWTLPDMTGVSDAFDREYDQNDYEEKITGLIERLDKRIRKENTGEYDDWHSAIDSLKRRDHYINVMISHAGVRPRGDRLRLWATAFAVAVAFVAFIYIAEKFQLTFGHRITGTWEYFHPDDSRDLGMWLWFAMIAVIAGYYVLRWILGAAKFDDLIGKLLRTVFRARERED